jgi:hydrogenase nickel insertion protein HypA
VHEYSVASSLLTAVEEHARGARASRVLTVHVRVGEQAGVELPLLRAAWELVREETPCAGAELRVQCVPLRWACPRCEREVPAGQALRCAGCGRPARLASGDELVLDRIEMEVDRV